MNAVAAVIHRTTLVFDPSANETEHQEPEYKHNPNMTAVIGVPQRYWKAPADWDAVGAGPVEMTAGEKAAVDAALAANNQGDGIVRYVLKKTTTTRNNNTLLADPELKFPALANQSYIFRGFIFFDTVAAADYKFGILGPASPVAVRIARWAIAPNATALSAIGILTAFNGAGVAVTATAGANGYCEFRGMFENGANAGNVEFAWAQNTTDAGNTRTLRGSYLEWARVGT